MPYVPPLENPYPAPGWNVIDDFVFVSDLRLLRLATPGTINLPREAQYILAQDYTVSFTLDGETRHLTVPAGTLTDLASVPRVARGYIGRVGPHLEAAIVHDFLYRAWRDLPDVKPTSDMQLFADTVMLAGMRAAGMEIKADVIYRSLRWFGKAAFFGEGIAPRYVNLNDIR